MTALPVAIRRLFVALTAYAFLIAGNPSARGDDRPASLSKEKLEAIPELLKKAVADKKIAGASALVAQRGKIVQISKVGFQEIEAKTDLSDSTIFRIASMSKPITSVAVMILVDDGKLKVTDPLSKFVPEFKEMKVLVAPKDATEFKTVDANREITIHDLLTHSSGISYRLLNRPFLGKMYADAGVSDGLTETPGTIGDNVKKLAKLPLFCQPGAAWEYGLNTDVLGYVVEIVSGKSLEAFMAERIFKPLKMSDTYFILPKEKHSKLSVLYYIGPDKSLARVGDAPVTEGSAVFSGTYPTREKSKYYSGGAGLVSTTGDYFRFCQMMLNRGELDGARILKAETVDTMTKNQLGVLRIPFPGSDAMGYGFGVLTEIGKGVSKDPSAVGSFGWGGAFNTNFWIDPKNEIIGVFMSQVFPPDFTVATEFKRLTYEALPQTKK